MHKQPRDDHDRERSDLSIMTAFENAKLFRIVHEAILLYHGDLGMVKADRLLEVYEELLSWRRKLPPELSNDTGDPSPPILILQ